MTDTECNSLFPHEIYQVYQDGKMKRYGLLFAVNGGAFAILKFSMEQMDATSMLILSLGLPGLMAVFTALMVKDIWKFGTSMREDTNNKTMQELAFQKPGQCILRAICALIIVGWAMLVTMGVFQQVAQAGPEAQSTIERLETICMQLK